MNSYAIELLKKSHSFDFSDIIIRHHQQTDMPIDDIKLLVDELKKWLILCAIKPENSYMLVGKVDKLWHTFVLFTRQYEIFCQEIAGHFIHHEPEISPFRDNQLRTKSEVIALEASYTKEERDSLNNSLAKTISSDYSEKVVSGYSAFIEDYKAHFEEQPNFKIWPRITSQGTIERQANGGGSGCGCGPTERPPHHDH